VPFTGNTEGIGDLSDDRGYVITILVTAVIAAPFVEEIVFRGLMLRGLLSRMGAVPAIGIQGVLFGVAHIDPVRGQGNLGLAMILSGVGLVLGASAYLFRRLGPTIVSHMITNTVAMSVTLLM
jgi:membrane protease YdiL (CAAX protease family)